MGCDSHKCKRSPDKHWKSGGELLFLPICQRVNCLIHRYPTNESKMSKPIETGQRILTQFRAKGKMPFPSGRALGPGRRALRVPDALDAASCCQAGRNQNYSLQ